LSPHSRSKIRSGPTATGKSQEASKQTQDRYSTRHLRHYYIIRGRLPRRVI